MALPAVGAIFSGVARAAATGGARAAAGAAMSGVKETARGAVRGAVKSAIGGKKGIRSGTVTATKGEGAVPQAGGGGRGGAIVPFGGSIVPAPKSESSIVPVAGAKTSILDQLRSINSTLQQILEVERKEKDKLEDTILDFVRRDEKENREEEQANQERKKGKGRKKQSPMVTAAKRAVGGIFDFILGLVGDFIKYKILEWLGDPKNRKNVQRIVEFLQGTVKFLSGLFKHVIIPLGGLVLTPIISTFKIFGSILQSIIDIFTLKWLTNPKEFLDNIINIPKTILGAVKDVIGAVLNGLTFGLFGNIEKLVGSIIDNFNPFKLIGGLFGGGDDKGGETAGATQPQKQESKGGGVLGAVGNVVGAVMNPIGAITGAIGGMFGGGNKEQTDVPQLAEGGVVEKDGNQKPTVKPLSALAEESEFAQIISRVLTPFMDMMMAPFKIIGTAIVGLILQTVSKIPFVGQLIEPIIKMAATAFGVPPSVMTQLKTQTNKKEVEDDEKLDSEEVAKKMMSGLEDIKKSKEKDKDFGSSLSAGFKSMLGGVGNFIGQVFSAPAAAATRPPGSSLIPSPGAPGDSPSTPGSDAPSMQGPSMTATGGSKPSTALYSGFRTANRPKHNGVDISGGAWQQGAPLSVIKPGTVVDVGLLSKGTGDPTGWGNFVVIKHDDGTHSLYGHLDSVSVAKGTRIENKTGKATVIGRLGSTGRSEGPHLHFEVGKSWTGGQLTGHMNPAGIMDSYVRAGGNVNVKQTDSPVLTATGSKTGPALQQQQQQSNALAAQPAAAGTPQMSVINGGSNTTGFATENMSPPTLGLTLPNYGLWSTYRTNL